MHQDLSIAQAGSHWISGLEGVSSRRIEFEIPPVVDLLLVLAVDHPLQESNRNNGQSTAGRNNLAEVSEAARVQLPLRYRR